MRLVDLAEKANISKGYLSTLERDGSTRVSGEKLYAIASVLGVTMSDLLGRRLLTEPSTEIPESLQEFAQEFDLPQSDVQMLARIEFRGERPRTKARWEAIYGTIRSSEWMDRRRD